MSLYYRGERLSLEDDDPASKVLAWSRVHLLPGRFLEVDVPHLSALFGMSSGETEAALATLVRRGSLRTGRGTVFPEYRLVPCAATLALPTVPPPLPSPETWRRGAGFSLCGRYRYTLWRIWDTLRPLIAFVLLNPSTADVDKNDPTVERCQRRAITGGFGGLHILNVFALRSTQPARLYEAEDPVGPENDEKIADVLSTVATVVCGWGHHGRHRRRGQDVLSLILSAGHEPLCLGTTAGGDPRHPLYVGYAVSPRRYSVPFPLN